MIYATGDCHANFLRFKREYFPEQDGMGHDDYMIICGDFGGVWFGDQRDDKGLNQLEALPFTTLFVTGNHENFEALAKYPVEEWHGGTIRRVRPHVLHLMRGQVFDIDGYSFFTMGGASSHDVSDGILEPNDPQLKRKIMLLNAIGGLYRINHVSWWKEELPSDEEYAKARRNLERVGYEVDYVISHCAPSSVVDVLGKDYQHDRLTDFFEEIRQRLKFHYWLFGHYHDNRNIKLGGKDYVLLYEQIVQVL